MLSSEGKIFQELTCALSQFQAILLDPHSSVFNYAQCLSLTPSFGFTNQTNLHANLHCCRDTTNRPAHIETADGMCVRMRVCLRNLGRSGSTRPAGNFLRSHFVPTGCRQASCCFCFVPENNLVINRCVSVCVARLSAACDEIAV